MSYFPPYLRVATISLLNLPALLFRWTRGVESRFSAKSQRWLLGGPLHRSTSVKAHAMFSLPLQWRIFFRPTGHYVGDNYSILSNMAHVYHIVAVRVIWTSWAHVWRLCLCFLRTRYEKLYQSRVDHRMPALLNQTLLRTYILQNYFFPCPYFLGFFKNCYLTLFLFQW
jgi:hypothetical protein